MKSFFSILFLGLLFAMDNECGTQSYLGPLAIQDIIDRNAQYLIRTEDTRDIRWVPISYHIVRDDNGEGGLPLYRIDDSLVDLNTAYEGTGLYFYQLGNIDFINNSEYYTEIDSYDEINALRNVNSIDNSLNVYCVADLSNGSADLCGISTFTSNSSSQGIVMNNDCFATHENRSTFAHEVGHYFDLLHTHTGSVDPDENGVIDGPNSEFVDGTSCDSRGDGLCDTPADPNLDDYVSNNCYYTADFVDGHGDFYLPDTSNFMSYSEKDCRDSFSNQQLEVALSTYDIHRPELNYPPLNPFISLYSYNVLESTGNEDSMINPGESIQIQVELKNWSPWPAAIDSELSLSSNSDCIEVINGLNDIGTIESGTIYNNQDDPFVIEVSNQCSLGQKELQLDFLSITDVDVYQISFSITIPVTLFQSGFPFATSFEVASSPLVIDFDDDGENEILFGDKNGLVHVLDIDGTELDNGIFPYDTGDEIWGSLAAADMDLDGLLDIAVASKSKFLTVLDINGVKFSYNTEQFLFANPVIGNFDDDPQLEVAASGFTSAGDVFLVNHDGTLVDGFPAEINEKTHRGPAVMDFDGNGKDDLLYATENNKQLCLIYDSGVFDTLFFADSKFKSAPSILNVGDDILITAGSDDEFFYAVDETGELVFSIDTGDDVNSPASFVDLDSGPVIFFGSESGDLHAVDISGNPLEGWPVSLGDEVNMSVSFADFDDDGTPEVVASASNMIYIYTMDGEIYNPNHFPIINEFAITSTPIIMDIDDDSDLEILIGSAATMVVVDVAGSGNATGTFWNMDRGNAKRHGVYVSFSSFNCDNVMLGNVNCDTNLDVMDVIIVVNFIMEIDTPSDSYQEWAGDYNQDGIIDVLDVVAIVNLILDI